MSFEMGELLACGGFLEMIKLCDEEKSAARKRRRDESERAVCETQAELMASEAALRAQYESEMVHARRLQLSCESPLERISRAIPIVRDLIAAAEKEVNKVKNARTDGGRARARLRFAAMRLRVIALAQENGVTFAALGVPTDDLGLPESDGDSVSADGDAVSADGDAVSADGDAAPADGDAAPADGDAAPADGGAAPADGDAAPAVDDDALKRAAHCSYMRSFRKKTRKN
jgi:hypothetical protein